MIHKTALLVVLFAFGNFAQAQDNTTAAPSSVVASCEPAYAVLELCDEQSQCPDECEGDLQVAADPGEQMGNPLEGIDDPTNTSGISDAIRAGFDAACGNAKEQVCNAKRCCQECVDALEAALQCDVDRAIPFLKDTLPSVLAGLGEAVDAGLGFLNEVVGSTLNTTIAPTGVVGQGGDDVFADVFASLTCDVKDNTCDAVPAIPGDSATPGESSAPGVTSAPGSPTAPGPSPVSSAIMTCRLYAVVAMAAVGMLLM
jgi:hypothetical protein